MKGMDDYPKRKRRARGCMVDLKIRCGSGGRCRKPPSWREEALSEQYSQGARGNPAREPETHRKRRSTPKTGRAAADVGAQGRDIAVWTK